MHYAIVRAISEEPAMTRVDIEHNHTIREAIGKTCLEVIDANRLAVNEPIVVVLNRLERIQYKVVSVVNNEKSGTIWTLHNSWDQ